MMKVNHLSDDRLIELSMLEAVSTTEQQHLSACARCDARRVRLQRMLDDVSDTATAAADAAFPPERLARQHSRILACFVQTFEERLDAVRGGEDEPLVVAHDVDHAVERFERLRRRFSTPCASR